METEFNLALARLIAINLGCSNLALAEAYCVASSNSTSTAPSSLAERSLANWIVFFAVEPRDRHPHEHPAGRGVLCERRGALHARKWIRRRAAMLVRVSVTPHV